jgi:uncharacterized protein (TIGR02391 family)
MLEDAVFNAGKTVEDEIRRLIGADESHFGLDLISYAMSGPNRRLSFGKTQGEHDGAHMLFRGVIGWFKNPRSHRYLDSDTRTATFEALALASHLMRMLDESTARSGQPVAVP